MKRWMKMVSCGLVVCMALTLVGCETYGQGAGLGAALGAGAGAIIGHQSGHALEGAAIGALAGTVAGLIAHDIKARKQKSREQTVQEYNYQPAQGEMMTFERAEVLPPTVRPGEMVSSTIQYALLGTGGGVEVNESRILMRGDKVISEVSSQSFTRDDGTWVSEQQFRLPGNQQPGQYTVMTKVRTAKSAVSGQASFIVQ